MSMYPRFFAMIATSTLVMFGLMYLNTYTWSHATYSETRTYMALVMGAAMAVIMLAFMTRMLSNRRMNIGIILGSILVFSLSLWLVRSQRTVEDLSYMRAMIPHHSIAILTSERARISDARVRKLADGIIEAQRREIAEMKALIDSIEAHGPQREPAAVETGNALLIGPAVPAPEVAAVEVPEGFRAEIVMSGLTYPTSVEFDDAGAMYVAESGYSYGDAQQSPRILRVAGDGRVATVAEGGTLVGPVNDLLWHDGRMYVSHRGRISVLADAGRIIDLVTGLPSDGDHHNNQMTIGPDGMLYFGQGTATNSAVVGVDSDKMGWLAKHPAFHDVPARDIALAGVTFETPAIRGGDTATARTSAYHPFGQSAADGAIVPGQIKANGTILRMNLDGTGLEVYAWGLRNPYGVMWSPAGRLYATENGFDDRGSRPIANDREDLDIIRQGAWYGWPDYAMGMPVTDARFRPDGKPQPQFLMAEHPPVEQPWLTFPAHAAITKLDIASSDAFGKGFIYVAFFGHMTPMTGREPDEHGGHRVVRIDPATKRVETFFSGPADHGSGDGHAAGHGSTAGGHGADARGESVTAGPRRLVDVRFTPAGDAVYIADFGSMVVEDKPLPVPGTGVVWRVVPKDARPAGPPANLSAPRRSSGAE